MPIEAPCQTTVFYRLTVQSDLFSIKRTTFLLNGKRKDAWLLWRLSKGR
jgi:hypothetical protein